MAECYDARINNICEVSFYDGIENDDIDEERLEKYFDEFYNVDYGINCINFIREHLFEP